jgi:hypothetical protein
METVRGRTPTYWLSMHVPYACRHSGACCSSGWDIPIERSRVDAVATLRTGTTWLRPVTGAPPDIAGVLAMSEGGNCVFHRDGCEIQHAFGHRALPTACQHFPREVLIDPRGVFVTLSHYCPTAADLLFTHRGPVDIVEGPPVLPDGDEAEGLDARDVLPPLLVDGVLMDWEGYSAWDAHAVAVLTNSVRTPEESLTQLEHDLPIFQRWRPGDASLTAVIEKLGQGHAAKHQVPRRCSLEDAVIGRFLASHAFASWEAFGSRGVAAVLTHLRLTLCTLRTQMQQHSLKEAIRQTDLELVHLRQRMTGTT